VSVSVKNIYIKCAICIRVQVFKLKGADRKHKQDREKVLRRPRPDLDKFQPGCDATVLTTVSIWPLFTLLSVFKEPICVKKVTYIHTYHSRFIPEGVAEVTQILLRDTHVLPKLVSFQPIGKPIAVLMQSISGVSAIIVHSR
jgi:hypothetical protein